MWKQHGRYKEHALYCEVIFLLDLLLLWYIP